MILPHRTDRGFWRLFAALPDTVQSAARDAYRAWRTDPRSGGLRFKRVAHDLYSLRIDDDYRAVARHDGRVFVWVWIGRHDEYARMLKA
jgi:hypothetical protein